MSGRDIDKTYTYFKYDFELNRHLKKPGAFCSQAFSGVFVLGGYYGKCRSDRLCFN